MQASTGETARKRPHLGVAIRVVVYGTALSYFGWQATQRFTTERRVADDNFRASVGQWLQHPPKTIVMPNGDTMPVLELTEEEAKQMGLLPQTVERTRAEAAQPDEAAEPAAVVESP